MEATAGPGKAPVHSPPRSTPAPTPISDMAAEGNGQEGHRKQSQGQGPREASPEEQKQGPAAE